MIPSFRALLTVDAEGYSRNPGAELPNLHISIRDVVESACKHSGLGDTWRSVRVLQSSGDGLLAILPVAALPLLIHPFADRLQSALAESAPKLRERGLSLRLRTAVHVGLVDDEDPVTGGISPATNEVSRLLNCQPLRQALLDSDPDVTFAAMIVSAEVYDQFVRAGHTGLAASRFIPVRARVKQFDRTAYLYVPIQSLRALEDTTRPDGDPDESMPDPADAVSVSHIKVTGRGSQNVIGAQVAGDIRQQRS